MTGERNFEKSSSIEDIKKILLDVSYTIKSKFFSADDQECVEYLTNLATDFRISPIQIMEVMTGLDDGLLQEIGRKFLNQLNPPDLEEVDGPEETDLH